MKDRYRYRIVLFKSIRNSKRRTKEILQDKVVWGGGQHYLVLNKISTL